MVKNTSVQILMSINEVTFLLTLLLNLLLVNVDFMNRISKMLCPNVTCISFEYFSLNLDLWKLHGLLWICNHICNSFQKCSCSPIRCSSPKHMLNVAICICYFFIRMFQSIYVCDVSIIWDKGLVVFVEDVFVKITLPLQRRIKGRNWLN